MVPATGGHGRRAPTADSRSDGELDAVLRHLRARCGLDFTTYKRPSLMRRVLAHTRERRLDGLGTLLRRLEEDPREVAELLNAILINVTSFFRDPAEWSALREDALPAIVGGPRAGSPIRVWSAGCASGEEPYSVAMLLADMLGLRAFRERVKIFATDLDQEALEHARVARYSARAIERVPAPLRARYVETHAGTHQIRGELREAMVIGRHDLARDPPIRGMQLVICRNCLIYFNAEAQARMLAGFRFSLVARGVLFLGKTESQLARRSGFERLGAGRFYGKPPRADGN